MSTIDKFQIKWLAAEGDNNFIYTLCPKQDINAFHFYVHRGYYNGNRTTEAQCGEVARRLMACWHACEGVTTENLEHGRIGINTILQERNDLQQKLDEMRNLLIEIGHKAHDASTGPAVPDTLWEIRSMAYGGEAA